MYHFLYSREKFAVFLLSIAIGTLIVAPGIYFRYWDGGYRGIDFFGSDAEHFYLAQIQEIYDGHWSLGNVYLAEGKDDHYVQPPLPPILVASLGKLLRVSSRDINLITKFLLPALLSVLLYSLFKNLFKRKDLALLMTAFILLTQATWIFLDPVSWKTFFLTGAFPGTNANFLTYSRPINPQVSSFFFFGYLLCCWKFLFDNDSEKSEKIFGTLSAVILGLSFYTYFFTFSFLSVFNAILFFWFLFSKDWRQSKKIMIVSVAGLAIAIPYFINLWGMLKSPFYVELTHRLGVAETHQFIFSRVWWGTTALFLLLYRKADRLKVFILAFLATAFFVTNQQLITGRTAPIPAHYHWYYIAPVGGAILIYLFFTYFEKFAGRSWSRLGMVVLMAVFFYGGFLFQKNSYLIQRDYFISDQRYAPVLSWLDKNVQMESSIFANDDLSEFIPSYTHHNVYYGNDLSNFLLSEERFKDSLYIYTFLKGVTKDSAGDFFYKNRDSVGADIWGQRYRMKNGCYGCFEDSILESLIADYKNFLDKDFVTELKRYRVDYIVWDKEKNPSWKMDRFFSKKIYEKDNLTIYSVS